MKRKGRGRRLLLEVGLLMIVFFLVSTGIVVNHVNEEYSKVYVASEGSQVMDFMSLQIRDMNLYDALPWLVEYWHNHHAEMDILPMEMVDLSWVVARQDAFNLVLDSLTASDMEALPEEEQKQFAEVVYVSFEQFVDQIGKTTDVSSLCIVKALEDGKAFVFYSWQEAGAENELAFGQVVPDEWNLMQNDLSISVRNIISRKDNREYVVVSCPFTYGDEVLFYICYNIPQSVIIQNLRNGVDNLHSIDVFLLLVIFFAMMVLLYFFFIRPLVTMQKTIHRYAGTRDRGGIEESLAPVARLRNEIGYLANEFIDMTGELDLYVKQIQETAAEKERNATELALARKIQMDEIPNRFPLFPGETSFDFHAFIEPAKTIGGDFYDVFMRDKTHVVLVAADVSGKGIPASLFMMRSRTVIRETARYLKQPSKILEKCNERLCENNKENMFVTVWLGIADLKTGEVVYAQAGHEPPAVRRAGTWKFEEIVPGCPLGAIRGETYTEATIPLAPGDLLFEYTDGVTEARNRDRQMYRSGRLLSTLNAESGETPEDVILNVKDDLYAFVSGEEQFDDVTMICFRYLGEKTE